MASAFAAAFIAAALIAQGASAEGAKMTYVDNAQAMDIESMGMPGINAFLQDVVGSDDPEKPITCALFRLEKSAEPLTYAYDYDEVKIVLDGVITVSDGTTTVDADKGDVLLLPKGSNITFTTASSGLAFVCGQRAQGGA